LLERERELVDLPKRIQDERRKEQALDEQLKAIQNEVQQVERQLVALDGSLAGLQRASADQAAALAQRQRELERWQREIAWTEQQELSLRRALAGLDAQEASLTASLAGERKRQEEAHRRAAILRQDMAALGSDIVTRLAEARTAAALGEQEERAQQMLLSNRRREIERLAAQLSAKERRVGELAGQATALEATIESARREGRDLSASIVSMHQKIDPAERAIDDLEKERAALLERELQARTRYSALERAHSQTAVEVQRARNELGKLQAQIEAEEGLGVKGFGLEEQDVKALLDELAVPVQLSLTAPVAPDATYQQKPAVDPDVLKRRVDGLRVQLRRLGPVNPNAVKEYEETLGRYAFMTSQSEDLEKAVHSLRAIIGELDELMRTRFETTFEAIGKEFRRYFTALFGGGTARLTLTDPEDLTQTGIDIVAQPPGKRLQNLALLSGGERALAATALLFAILTVNPIPFCVLDEVDAALDDANVGRFCELLRSLSERTQFIVITHNKGTMETASSLYGVSMAADSTSQVLSLRLEDIPA
jgi:chromosome segregation protein